MLRAAALLLLFALTACPHPGPGPGPDTGHGPRIDAKADPRAAEALKKALAVADSRPRREGIEALLSVRKAFPETTEGQDALYRAGVLAFEEGDYVVARKSLNELIFENPLHPQATDARLKAGLAALELKAFREAYVTLSSLVDRLEGEDKRRCVEAMEKAAAGSQQFSEALKLGLKNVEAATDAPSRLAALGKLETVVDSQATFLSIAEAWHDVPVSHPAWPLLTFKMARVYYHLRDWKNLDGTLKTLLKEAPASPYSAEAKALLERTARRGEVKPRVVGVVLPLSGKYKALGEVVQRNLQLAFKGSDVELVIKNSEGDANLAGQMVEQLVFEDGAIAVIGPLMADDSKRAALVAEELQIPLITLSRTEGLPRIGPHVFRTMVTNSQQAEALAAYAMDSLGYKTFAVLSPNIPFGQELTNEFWDAVEKRGGQIRGAETYDHDQTTFTDDAKRLAGRYFIEDRADYGEKVREVREAGLDDFHKRKALEKLRKGLEPVIDFEALLIPDTWQRVSMVAPALAVEDIITNACDKKDLERIQKTTGKDKMKTVTLLGPSTWSSPKGASGDPLLIERGQKYVLCSVYVDGFWEQSERPATKAYVAAFHEAHPGASLSMLDAVAWDTGSVVRQVLEKNAPKSAPGLPRGAGPGEGLRGRHRADGLRRRPRAEAAALPAQRDGQGHQGAGAGQEAGGVRLTAPTAPPWPGRHPAGRGRGSARRE